MDPNRAELLDKIKAQGDVVRKLKEQKAEKVMVRIANFSTFFSRSQMCFYHKQDFSKLATNLNDLNDRLSTRSYIGDEPWPTTLDSSVFDQMVSKNSVNLSSFPNVSRWFKHIQSYDKTEQKSFPKSQTSLSSSNNLSQTVRG